MYRHNFQEQFSRAHWWPYLITYVRWICDMSVWTNYFWLILGRVKRKNAKKGQSGGAADDEDAED